MMHVVAALFTLLFSASLGVERDDVAYFLFNKNSDNVQIDDSNLNLVDSTLPIIFIIHGWADDSNGSWVQDLTDAYLDKDDYNVITVDWSGPAGDFYPSTVEDVKFIAQYLGEIINRLYVEYGADASSLHLVGHSLGAQIAGLAGQILQELSGVNIGRITALDAALPLFALEGEEGRLSKDDAALVVAIHTDGGVAGFLSQVGHIDFYPNGGTPPQPGCIDITTSCSHSRSTEYFLEALNNPSGFVSKECSSYLVYKLGLCEDNKTLCIGGELSAQDEGSYYLKTNSEEPYSKE